MSPGRRDPELELFEALLAEPLDLVVDELEATLERYAVRVYRELHRPPLQTSANAPGWGPRPRRGAW